MGKRIGLARIETLVENLQREINLGRSSLRFGGSGGVNDCTITGMTITVENITADRTLTQADSGKVFQLDSADESGLVSITLPVVEDLPLNGTTYKFYVKDASNGGFAILTGDRTTNGDLLTGYALLGANQVSSTTNGANGRIVAPNATNHNTITLDANATNGGGERGTVVTVTNVNSTDWLVEGVIFTAQATATGADIFSDTAA
jgi:hypothetical protein